MRKNSGEKMSLNAKDAHITYQQARNRENKPICLWCYVPCDPRSRTYRATHLCEFCYDDQPIALEKKELLPCQTLSDKAER